LKELKNSSFENACLKGLIVFAALLLASSLAVHIATFVSSLYRYAVMDIFGLIHILIFIPFGAAIFLANRWGGKAGGDSGQDIILSMSPKPCKLIAGFFFAYAILNFILSIVISGGGGPRIEDGNYVISSHGQTLKQITEAEYIKARAQVTRGFSGHWMLFSSASLALLLGVYNLRKRRLAGENVFAEFAKTSTNKDKPSHHTIKTDSDEYRQRQCRATQDGPLNYPGAGGREFSKPVRLLSLIGYGFSVWVIISGNVILYFIIAPPLIFLGRGSLRGVVGNNNFTFKTMPGCLSVIPNFFLAIGLAGKVVRTGCVALYAGFVPAITNKVTLLENGRTALELTNGEFVNSTVWGISHIITFLLMIFIIAGLTGLVEATFYVRK
jgi:hypothetical protein